jgi:ABC-type multidrug transport system fused ATPase/permease subunit
MRPYRLQIGLAVLFLVLAAAATLLFPVALRHLIDGGLVTADRGAQAVALRGHFLQLFGVAVALGVFSAARFYLVSWLGERITADLRNAVYSHVLRQSPQFFETTQTGEVLSRLTTDTTLVQTVVGSSLSMGLRNAVMGIGAVIMLVWTNPYVMLQVSLIILLVVLPSMWFGRRVRKLSRASQDRVADSSAIAAEVLNAIPIVQSYTAEDREALRFADSTEQAFGTAVKRSRARAGMVAFIIISTAALLLWGLYQGTQAVIAGRDQRRAPGPDGGLHRHPGRRRGRAGRGVWRLAAGRRRQRAIDGTAEPGIAGAIARRSCARRNADRAAAPCVSITPRSTTRHARRRPRWQTFRSKCNRARPWPWWGPAVRARARCSACCCATTTQPRDRSRSTVCRSTG